MSSRGRRRPTRQASQGEAATSSDTIGTIVAVLSAVATIAAALVGYWTFQVADRTMGLSGQGQYQDRFDRAADKLGNQASAEVRLAAIMAFERLVEDAPSFRDQVVGILSGFIRQQAPANTCDSAAAVKIDIQEALNAIGKHYRPPNKDSRSYPLNLRSTCLRGVNLSGFTLNRADLGGANLTGALLDRTQFEGAYLVLAKFNHATILRVDFTCATLVRTNFSKSAIVAANMTGAELMGPDFHDALFSEVKLDFAVMIDVALTPEQQRETSQATMKGAFCFPPNNYEQAPLW